MRPLGWTATGLRIASLPEVLLLVLMRAQIAERRMDSAPIECLLDETRKVLGHVRERVERHRIDRLDLQGLYEAFGRRVRIAPPAYRATQAPFAVKSWRYGAAAYCSPRSEWEDAAWPGRSALECGVQRRHRGGLGATLCDS